MNIAVHVLSIIVLTETTALLACAPGPVEPCSITLKRCSRLDALHAARSSPGLVRANQTEPALTEPSDLSETTLQRIDLFYRLKQDI
jgi:hypothetical protein